MSKVILVACVSKKLDHAAPAAELYRSPWFRKARRYAELTGGRWSILSAKYGLVTPDEVIEPYDATLRRAPVHERRRWAQRVVEQLTPLIDPAQDEIVVLAGKAYRETMVARLVDLGYVVSVPMEGLGIGQQLRWLNRAIEELRNRTTARQAQAKG